MKVLVDDRERSSGVAEHLASIDDVAVEFCRLETGDYEVPGQARFERKTLSDLGASIIDGRLFEQAARMARSTLPPIAIIEGTSADLTRLGIRREALQGGLITLTVIYGIPLLRSMGPEETAHLIWYTASQVSRSRTGSVIRHSYKPKRKRRRQLHILQGLPGVGPDRAERLLEAFGTVEGVVTASQDRLLEVPGIGAKVASDIRWAVREAKGTWPTPAHDPCR